MQGHVSRRALRRRGCKSCRTQRLFCDISFAPCDPCVLSGRSCILDSEHGLINPNHQSVAQHRVPAPSHHTSAAHGDGYRSITPRKHSEPRTPLPVSPNSLAVLEVLSTYTSEFNKYNYQICAWTNLLALPRRSNIPTLLNIPSRRGKKANWATFYLPHLSLGTPEDVLSVSIAAFTALRMEHYRNAGELYLRAIGLLRKMLLKKDASSMENMVYLRLWSSVLLLAEYEGQLGNQDAQYQHLTGASTLSEGAMTRFPRLRACVTGSANESPPSIGDTSVSDQASSRQSLVDANDEKDYFSAPPSEPSRSGADVSLPISSGESKTERDLPNYLMALNRRLEHSKAIRLSRDTLWPSFYTPADRLSIGALHEKSAGCYRLVMPLLYAYYGTLEARPPRSLEAHGQLLATFQQQVKAARKSIAEYQQMIHKIYGNDSKVYKSCAQAGFPFSPVIKFVDPQMAQPSAAPYIFLMFLAPFITATEHYEAIRHISGVFAGFQDNPGLLIDASFPDVHVAAFWRRGAERDYFAPEGARRGGDFLVLLTRIWNVVDHLEAQAGRVLDPGTILGISLREYAMAQKQGLTLKNTRH